MVTAPLLNPTSYSLRVLVALLTIVPAGTFASDTLVAGDGSRPAIDVVEATIRTHAIIGFSWIDQPLNRIVLIRTQQDLCAIKYLSFSRGHAQQPSSASRSEDGPFYGEAELYSTSKRTVRPLHLTQFPFRGFHPFVFGGGRPYFQCGRQRIVWSYPTGTLLPPDADASLASTQWQDFSKIDFHDPNLQWFRYDASRKMVIR